MYERSFPAIGERFFKKTAWPTPDAIATYAENDPVFKMLYAELYYRHLHQATTPSANERKGSWENYCELFGALLHGDANMQLPNVWLYEMVDEFVYQFQSFRQFKGSSKRTSEELQAIKALDAQVWDRTSMLNFLKALVDKSDIVRVLERERAGEISFAANEGYALDSSNVLPTLGYCAQIGICRLHVLTGVTKERSPRSTPWIWTRMGCSRRFRAPTSRLRITSGSPTLCSADTRTPFVTLTKASSTSNG